MPWNEIVKFQKLKSPPKCKPKRNGMVQIVFLPLGQKKKSVSTTWPLELMNHEKPSKEAKKNDTFVIAYEYQRKMPRIF